MIKTVVCDFADTIAELNPRDAELFQRIIRDRLGVNIEIAKIENVCGLIKQFNFYSSVNIKSPADRRLFYCELNSRILRLLGVFHEFESSADFVYDYFLSANRKWKLKDGVIDLFLYLKKKGVSIGILSNFDSKLKRIVSDMKLDDIVDYMLVSQDVSVEKPDQLFYEMLIDKYNLVKDEILYVGDNYELDYLPARKVGMQTVLLDEIGLMAKHGYVIRELQEILSFFEDCEDC